jgi:hypothetical protein
MDSHGLLSLRAASLPLPCGRPIAVSCSPDRLITTPTADIQPLTG